MKAIRFLDNIKVILLPISLKTEVWSALIADMLLVWRSSNVKSFEADGLGWKGDG